MSSINTEKTKKVPMTPEALERIKIAEKKKPQPVNQEFIKRAEDSVKKNQIKRKH